MKSGQKKSLESMDKFLEDEDVNKIRMPVKEDFCWIILRQHWDGLDLRTVGKTIQDSRFPCRPVPLKETDINLDEFHCADLEHTIHMYRLYFLGPQAKGVFRGDDMLVTESISVDDEFDKFAGLLLYNKGAYEKALKDWHSYWDWVRNRNEARWIDQEKGKLNYDAKNMMHCMRLIMSCENILKHGEPIVRFEGKARDYLMSIRAGELEYDTLMAEVDRRMAVLETLKDGPCAVPDEVDFDSLRQLYRGMVSAKQ